MPLVALWAMQQGIVMFKICWISLLLEGKKLPQNISISFAIYLQCMRNEMLANIFRLNS